MKDLLNSRIKHREPFRPFAPSILAERVGDYFEETHPSPFMLMAYKVKPREAICDSRRRHMSTARADFKPSRRTKILFTGS